MFDLTIFIFIAIVTIGAYHACSVAIHPKGTVLRKKNQTWADTFIGLSFISVVFAYEATYENMWIVGKFLFWGWIIFIYFMVADAYWTSKERTTQPLAFYDNRKKVVQIIPTLGIIGFVIVASINWLGT